jgi:Ca2+-binding EF-hand superfamily protein
MTNISQPNGKGTMAEKTIANMSDPKFDELVEHFIERGEDQVTLPTFLSVMADIAEQRKAHEVKLTGGKPNGL